MKKIKFQILIKIFRSINWNAVTAIAACIAIWATYSNTSKQLEINKQAILQQIRTIRPYVKIDNINWHLSKEKITITFFFSNSGQVCAQNLKYDFRIKSSIFDKWKECETEQEGQAILFPNQDNLSQTVILTGKIIEFIINKKEKPNIKVVLTYDGIETTDHTTQVIYQIEFKDNKLIFGVKDGYAT